jgi:hypothetical protein
VVVATDVVVLDHLAVAVERSEQAWPRYRDELGGRWASISGYAPGFEFSQVQFVGGMKIEVLSPHEWEASDFLHRFLEHSGAGPHHITFKVPDMGVALERCRAMGYRTVGERRENPNWQEAFLHPKDGAGVVIQLAQEGSDDHPDAFEEVRSIPAHWPGDPLTPQTKMDFVAHAVTEFHTHVRRFTELLDGRIDTTGHDDFLEADLMDLIWPNGARLRLLRPSTEGSPVRAWLGERHARVHHAAFSGVVAERTEIPPDQNLGLRLILT